MTRTQAQEWLLIFYSVPANPVSSRMKIWRRLSRAGAVQLKGAVYILPSNDEHRELFQWLVGEVKSLGGDGLFVRTGCIETMADAEVRRLFDEQRAAEYRELDKALENLERSVQVPAGAGSHGRENASATLAALKKTYTEIRSRDFFNAPAGREPAKRLQALETMIRESGRKQIVKPATLSRKNLRDYRGRTWVTRKRPFIDRMASAWLIRKFIDPAAVFRFVDEKNFDDLAPAAIAFDMQAGEFTHSGDLCTFEVLVRSFGIKDRPIRKIAELVHDLDLKDDKYGNPAAGGIEDILTGIRKTAKNDSDMLEQGMAVFEMLYRSKS